MKTAKPAKKKNHTTLNGIDFADRCRLAGNFPGRGALYGEIALFENTAANFQFIDATFPNDVDWSSVPEYAALKAFDEQAAVRVARKAEHNPTDADVDKSPYLFKTRPYAHQLKALDLAYDSDTFAFFMEMGCVDAKTEYLSPTGWVKMADYAGGQVAQWHPDTREISFVEPTEYIKKPCHKMIRIKTARGVDQLLSPEHRVAIENRAGEIVTQNADDLYNWSEVHPRTVRRLPSTYYHQGGSGIGLGLSPLQLRIQIAVMADGHFPAKAPHTTRVSMKLKKGRKIDRLKYLLTLSNTEYKLRYEEKTGFYVFAFYAPLRLKKFSSDFWGASREERVIISDEVFHWDGSQRAGNRDIAYFSKHKADVDFIQYLYSSLGRVASIGHDKREGKEGYYVNVRGRNSGAYSLKGENGVFSWENSSDGFKYCFSVPTTFLLFRRNGCIFPSGNTGKTKVQIDLLANWYRDKRCGAALIAAPNGVHVQWVKEQIADHWPEELPIKTAYYRSCMRKPERDAVNDVLNSRDRAFRLMTINIEALSHASGVRFAEDFLTRFAAHKPNFTIDESSRIKTPGATRTTNCFRLGKLAASRHIMTGSPVTKGVENLFAQFKFLDERILGFKSYWTFKNRFCVLGGFEQKQIVGYRNIDLIQSRMEGHSYRVRKEDCLDLPEKVYDRRYIELTPAQKKAYAEVKEDLMTQLEDGTVVTAPIAIVSLVRLQQILCGYLPDEEGKTHWLVEPDKNPRIKACVELMEEAQSKTIIWCRFIGDIKALSAAMDKAGIGHVTYFGETTATQRTEAIEAFRHDDKVRAFIANPAAAGIGLNLTVASNVIYYSNSFDAELRWQSEDRAHRIGQTQNVTYYDLIARGTLDTKIVANLRKKRNLADLTIDGIKEMLNETEI